MSVNQNTGANGKKPTPTIIWVLVGLIAVLLALLIYFLAKPQPKSYTAATTTVQTARPAATAKPAASSSASHVHSWAEANCERPATCTLCGETKGSALGHSWVAATYDRPRHCSVCGKEEGGVLSPTPAPKTSDGVDLYTMNESYGKYVGVSVAHSGNLSRCETCVKRMREAGYNAYLYEIPGKDGYSIVVGVYGSKAEGDELAAYLKEQEPVQGVKLEGAYSINVYLNSTAVSKYASPWW